MKTVLLESLKAGTPFVFTIEGVVYVRCKGGYCPGRGGPVVRFSHDQKVIRYLATS